MTETQADLAHYQSDHDLLIRVDTRMEGLLKAFEKLDSGTATEIKAQRAELDNLNFWRGVNQGVGLCVILLIAALGWFYVSFSAEQSTLDARINKAINTALINYSLIKN